MGVEGGFRGKKPPEAEKTGWSLGLRKKSYKMTSLIKYTRAPNANTLSVSSNEP
jgi:hypothetical protein